MAGQRTFTLIPQHPGRHEPPDQPSRPMTSKQIKKAYKEANRGPKLSRAERIKQERAEQERIRKEFEKEKAAAKAKVAREKKKEKEQAERDAKRKKGLPLVSVRPSQDTISWFVRGNGTAKKRDAEGKQVEAKKTPELEAPHSPAPEPKLDKIVEEDEEEEEKVEEKAEEPEEEPKEELMEEQMEGQEEDREEKKEKDKVEEEKNMDHGLDDLDDSFEEDLALELLEHVEASARQVSFQKADQVEQQPIVHLPAADTTIQRESKPTTGYEHDLGLEKPAQPKPAPPRPCPVLEARSSPSPSPSPPRQAPPLSTQAILFNFDDFFPSPSQQARELEEGLDDEDFDFSVAPRREPEKSPPKEPEPPEPSLPEPAFGSPSPPPRRFFTSSGSHELMSIALQRSRRTAALEQMQRRERARREAAEAAAEAQARMRRDKARAKAAAATASRPQAKPVARPNGPDRSTPTNNAVMQRKPENTKLNTQITLGKPVPKARPPPLQQASKPWTPRPNLAETRSNNATPRAHAKPNITTTRASTTTRPEPLPKAPVQSSPKSNLMQGQGNKENKTPHRTPAVPHCEAQAPSASQETDYGGGEWLDDIASELMI